MGTNKSRDQNSNVKSYSADSSTDEAVTESPLDKFCILYDDLMIVVNSMKGAEVKLTMFICQKLAVRSKGMIYLSATFKDRAVKATGYTERSINRAIDGLLKMRVILPMPDSRMSKRYHVNPLYIWKGDRDDRSDAIRTLGLNSTTSPKPTGLKGKASKVRVKQVKIDFDASIRSRKQVVHTLVKGLQEQFHYPDHLCKKFYEYYTEIVSETTDEQKIMMFEQQELKENRPFNWAFRLKSWHRNERPDRASKAEEQNHKLKQPIQTISHKDLFG